MISLSALAEELKCSLSSGAEPTVYLDKNISGAFSEYLEGGPINIRIFGSRLEKRSDYIIELEIFDKSLKSKAYVGHFLLGGDGLSGITYSHATDKKVDGLRYRSLLLHCYIRAK